MELLSVIVPVYNVAAYLRRCIESLVSQTYSPGEIILVDDGSTDGSGQICDALAREYENITVIHKPNGGVSSARNAGLEQAKGVYIAFVDSDDWVDPEMFRILVDNLKNHDADVSACDFIHTYKQGQSEAPARSEQVSVWDQQELYRMTVDPVHFAGYAWNKVFRRDVIGDLRFDETLACCEDIDFVSKLVGRCRRGVYEPVGLYYYFHHAQSMTGEQNFSYRKIAVIDVYERLLKLYSEVCPECLWQIQANYLKQNINVKGRYLCSRVDDPEVLERLNRNIQSCFGPVMKDSHVGLGTKANILISRCIPATMLRSKQFILRMKAKRK